MKALSLAGSFVEPPPPHEAAMYVRDVMTPDPVVAWPSTSVLYARRLMERHGIRHLPVVADAGAVGMVSARDIVMTDQQLAASLAELQSDLVTGRRTR
ncbi:MAG: CBS domain-containing protein [Actinobacteria bacterium]|nr:CBS domain-containing protein [Actinomycetota bacterium]